MIVSAGLLWNPPIKAQPNSLIVIPAETEERIRDIYERNVYQPRRVQAEWLPDSSGFLAPYAVPESGKITKKFLRRVNWYELRTNLRTISQPA